MVALKEAMPIDSHAHLGMPQFDTDLDEVVDRALEAGGKVTAPFHCFSGDFGLASRLLEMNRCISVPGAITFPNAKETREVIRYAPLDGIPIETDSPFLAPQSYCGKRSDPSYVCYVAGETAQIKGSRSIRLPLPHQGMFGIPLASMKRNDEAGRHHS
jgi:Tat protein secretion system quality control protein TatD with DNase activity